MSLMTGFSGVISIKNIALLTVFGLVGFLFGVMPGLNQTIAMSLLIPFTFSMDTVPALCIVLGAYFATNYGGGVTAILLGIPGTPSAAPTVLDGYPLAKQGKARKAVSMSIIASGVGALFSALLMISFTVPMAAFALRFSSHEFFILSLMGLSVVAGLSADNLFKGLVMAAVGLFMTSIGMDPISGSYRYVASFHLLEGVPFIPALIGLFAISEVFVMMTDKSAGMRLEKMSGEGVTRDDMKEVAVPVTIGSIIGFIVGMIPAAGPNIASFIAYGQAKRFSKKPGNFGKGELSGVAAPESANNAAATAALVPALALGIPGSSGAAIFLGTLTLHGISVGPMLFQKNPEIPGTIFAISLIIIPILVLIGLKGSKFFALVSLVPKDILAPVIIAVSTLGAYAVAGTMFGVWAAFFFGIVGYILRRFEYSISSMVLALVLGRMMEINFRRAMLVSGGSLVSFVTRPSSVFLMLVTLLLFSAFPLMQMLTKKRNKKDAQMTYAP